MKNPLVEMPVVTADGEFTARYSENGLVELDFPVGRASSRAAKIVPAKIRGWHRLTEVALQKILVGRPAKKLPPLDWTGRTEFQKSVWRALQKISSGKTKSYGEIAAVIGKPKAVRAVRTRFRCWCRVTVCWRRMGNSEASPADWIGNAPCWRAKPVKFNQQISFLRRCGRLRFRLSRRQIPAQKFRSS
jgi:alkylated DNA nucleotide flippase Atl1